jgi:hypothetical protein
MLAEIFISRLEAMLRASEQADREKNYRFVPLADNVHIAPTGAWSGPASADTMGTFITCELESSVEIADRWHGRAR